MTARLLLLALFVSLLGPAGLCQEVTSPAPAAAQPASDSTSPAHDNGSTAAEAKTSAAFPDLTSGPDGKLSQEQMQQLFRVVADKDVENDKRLRNYTYTEREVQNRLDGKGNIKSTEIKTYEVLEIYGEQVQRLVAKGDKPLDAKEAAKEEEKIQKIIDKRKNESESDRRKREEKEEKDREEGRQFVKEVADAFNFTLVGGEIVGGRDAWVIDAEPRPDFEPHMKQAKFLSKFHGRVWIDKTDLQLTKMDVECLDTISLGVFLARFHKGSRLRLEQNRVNNEVWLPQHLAVKVDVRVALMKNFNVDLDQSFRDYKKFQASSKIVGMGEVPEQQ
jgi:hypothetical protein